MAAVWKTPSLSCRIPFCKYHFPFFHLQIVYLFCRCKMHNTIWFFSPLLQVVLRWNAIGFQSAGSSSPLELEPASVLWAAAWPRFSLLSHGHAQLVQSHTPKAVSGKAMQELFVVFLVSCYNHCFEFSATHHPRFLLLQQLYHVQMSLPFIETVHIQLVSLVPLFGLL